ncbi:hypothetical protein Ddc_00696 [Ditylenchus destructor]|nr:hypothetical protein Ddc_00696 [Ditylenchus destructor]
MMKMDMGGSGRRKHADQLQKIHSEHLFGSRAYLLYNQPSAAIATKPLKTLSVQPDLRQPDTALPLAQSRRKCERIIAKMSKPNVGEV